MLNWMMKYGADMTNHDANGDPIPVPPMEGAPALPDEWGTKWDANRPDDKENGE